MVKKIRVIDEPEEEIPVEDATKLGLEILKSMDWKVWEILQTLQRLEKKIQIFETQQDDE